MEIKDNVKTLRDKHKLTQQQFADALGVVRETVVKWEAGKPIRDRNVSMMVEVFGIEPDDIKSANYGLASQEYAKIHNLPKGATLPSFVKSAVFPLLGRAHAGIMEDPELLEGEIEAPGKLKIRHPKAFALQVKGDCMDKVFTEWSHMLVDPDIEPQSGSIAVVSINDEVVVRRFIKGATTLILSPESHNAEHDDIVITAGSETIVENIGTVFWFQSNREME